MDRMPYAGFAGAVVYVRGMQSSIPSVSIRATLGRRIPGNGTVFIGQSTFSPLIGECIYCGGTDGLTDEHTIPYSLYGVAKLRQATCSACTAETQRIEQRLLRDTFGQAREYLGLPTRKSRKAGRWRGTRRGIDQRTGAPAVAPLADGVVALHLPYPDYPPRVFAGEAVAAKYGVRSLSSIALNDSSAPLPPHFEDGWVRFNPTDLERCIAKIALCEAIRVADPSIRDRVVSRFIIRGEGDSSLFLGAAMPDAVSDEMHSITHNRLRGREGVEAWMTNIQIFAFLPTPVYSVVLRPNGPFED